VCVFAVSRTAAVTSIALPDDVISALRPVQPLLEHDPVIVQGFRTWAAAINPGAAHFIDEIAAGTARRGLAAVGVIVLP
jgi:hypothetical protein